MTVYQRVTPQHPSTSLNIPQPSRHLRVQSPAGPDGVEMVTRWLQRLRRLPAATRAIGTCGDGGLWRGSVVIFGWLFWWFSEPPFFGGQTKNLTDLSVDVFIDLLMYSMFIHVCSFIDVFLVCVCVCYGVGNTHVSFILHGPEMFAHQSVVFRWVYCGKAGSWWFSI